MPGRLVTTVRGALARMTRRDWVRLSVLLVILAAGGVLLLVYGVPDFEAVRAEVLSLGAWAPVLYVLTFLVLTAAPFPKSVLSVVAGAVWGLGIGTLLGVVAGVLGASVSFAIARVLGKDAVAHLVGPRLDRIDQDFSRRGFLAVLVCRLIPVLPFTLLNYAFGVTAVRFRHFLAGTAIGIIPGTATYVAVGAYGAQPFSWQFWTALGVLGLLTVVGIVVSRRRTRRVPGTDPQPVVD